MENVMILVAYASKYGSSKDVAEHIARRLREKGKQAEIRSAEAGAIWANRRR
jgi:menaquinone-dependent protoporphyrinogen IX oxidase